MTYDADVSFAKYQAIMDMHNIPKAHIVFLGGGGGEGHYPHFPSIFPLPPGVKNVKIRANSEKIR